MTANEMAFERDYWGDCTNTIVEENRQYVYARLMGLRREHWSFRVFGASILDIGGGPVSMLLKCHDAGPSFVVDPLLDDYPEHIDMSYDPAYPKWVTGRYHEKGITVVRSRGEDLTPDIGEPDAFDECWIYNCLQHVDDPALVLKNALTVCRKLRIFEWVNQPISEGHPQALTCEKLDTWIDTVHTSDVVPLSYECCAGDAYVAVAMGRAK